MRTSGSGGILQKIVDERVKLRQYCIGGIIFGGLYALAEYLVRKDGGDPQLFLPLMLRGTIAGGVIIGSVALFEILSKGWFSKRPFGFVLLVRSLVYMVIINLCLLIANAIWFIYNGLGSVWQQVLFYFEHDEMYIVNLVSIAPAVVLAVGLGQINSLHRKGELVNFILGRFHTPKEIDRIFYFADLKNSTTIAEKLGHVQFALFLRDYFSDISDAIRKTHAGIYQYIGDEIVLMWSFEDGLKDGRCINCFFEMQRAIDRVKEKYLERYGVFPEFRAGLHGGRVTVTWVGELKKEIVYIGDVVNTTARIREECKVLGVDILISKDLLELVKLPDHIKPHFMTETVPRGKAKSVKIYSLEEVEPMGVS